MHEDGVRGEAMREALKTIEQHRQIADAAQRFIDSIDVNRTTKSAMAVHEALHKSLPRHDIQVAVERIQQMTAPFREPEFIAAAQRLREGLNNALLAIQPTILPAATAADQLLRRIAETITPYEGMFHNVALWQESLVERMNAMRSHWALEAHLNVSVTGFARLSRLSDVLHSSQPYGEIVAELVREELGKGCLGDESAAPLDADTGAVAAGMNAELIAFAPSTYSEVTFFAGFRFSLATIEPPRAIEAEDPGAVYDPMHWTILLTLENTLRRLVEKELCALEGEAWLKRRVPGDMRKRWVDRQAEERTAGRPVYGLVHYADFMDLSQLICQRDNWSSFLHIFTKKDDFRISLERLHPIRRDIAHGRPIGRAGTLMLVSEATRVLQALQIARLLP